MCCSGAVTRLAQLSHNMTMMDRKRQAARIHRGRPERLRRRGGGGSALSLRRLNASVSPGHAAQEVVLSRGVLYVLDGVLALPACFTCRSLSVTPHTYNPTEHLVRLRPTRACVHACCVLCSHRGAFGCESGPGARVCPPRWTEGPATRAGSTPSLAGSEEREGERAREKTRIKLAMTAAL